MDQRPLSQLPGGVRGVAQICDAGILLSFSRAVLASKSGVPSKAILGFVELSDLDLASVAGLESIRTRLYYDAAIDTLDYRRGIQLNCEPCSHRLWRT